MASRGCLIAGFAVIALSASTSAASASTMPASKAASPQCLGKPATIVGTVHAETIHGTPGPDVIVGRGGADTIYGGGGADTICAFGRVAERATVHGGAGSDQLRGAGTLYGGPGADEIIDPQSDSILGATMIGGTGGDELRSDAVTGDFTPGPGNDIVFAAHHGTVQGRVRFTGARRGVVVDLRRGTAVGQGHDILINITYVQGSRHGDVILGSGGSDFLVGGPGNDDIAARGGDDYVLAGTGDDHVDGGPGNDTLTGQRGSDSLFGRGGDDVLIEQSPEPNVIVCGAGKDVSEGNFQVPPNTVRGCETHRVHPAS